MAKFEKLGLRWGHLMWPESVTFSPKSIKFSEDLYKWWRNSYTKFGAAARRRFFAILKTSGGGADTRPPPAGVRVKWMITYVNASKCVLALCIIEVSFFEQNVDVCCSTLQLCQLRRKRSVLSRNSVVKTSQVSWLHLPIPRPSLWSHLKNLNSVPSLKLLIYLYNGWQISNLTVSYYATYTYLP